MEIIGYISSLLIGISLGMIGGGGSILTVPTLVYFFSIDPITATSYSLFIVGSSSIVGSIQKWKLGNVNFKAAFSFGSISVITVLIIRKFFIPLIPHTLFSLGKFSITQSFLTMIIFAILMIFSGLAMIRSTKKQKPEYSENTSLFKLITWGIIIGLTTGLLGAGAGFLLIPALVLLLKLPVKTAIGTSLTIIALNSIIGFVSSSHQNEINWNLLLSISSLSILGIFIGNYYSKKLNAENLKKGFAWFVLITGVLMCIKELWSLKY